MIIVAERKNQIVANQVLFSNDFSIFVYDLSNLWNVLSAFNCSFSILHLPDTVISSVNVWFDDLIYCVLRHFQLYFSYNMAASFNGGRSRSTRRELPTMGKQLGSFITCGCDSSTPFLQFTKPGANPRRIGDKLVWLPNSLSHLSLDKCLCWNDCNKKDALFLLQYIVFAVTNSVLGTGIDSKG